MKHALVIAGKQSGVGKPTVSTALMAALRRRGLTVQGFKVGPDFIDPGFHAAANGRPSRNVDGWMLDRNTNRRIFLRATTRADVAVVEGIMGLFDGASGSDELVHGFETFDLNLPVIAVIANQVAGEGHYRYKEDSLCTSCKLAKALMVLGTASHAGKSLTVAALCRILRQDGFDVAPFKAQNMALNSFATSEGDEIGRAQAMQAQAAGIEPHVDMNPILLKPTSDVGSQVILNGKVLGNYRGVDYYRLRPQLLDAVSAAYQRLASRHEIVVLEGAGSPVEMNLKDRDVVNLKMAEIANAACLLVTDIDRGGVFASLVGTYALLEPDERERFCGFLINKFRGDVSLFEPGIDYLEARLSQTCLGVIPYLHNHGIDDEDSVSLERRAVRPPPASEDKLCVCVIGLPYLSNFTDFTALENLTDVIVYYARQPEDSRSADVLILPGSKNTIPDLLWLKANGWEAAIEAHVAAGKPLAGICGGFQMLGREIRDPHRTESDVEVVSGLNLLHVVTILAREKVTRQATAQLITPSIFANGAANANALFTGYEIHLGETLLGDGTQPLFRLQRLGDVESRNDGAIDDDGRTFGTYLHGLFDSADGLTLLLSHWRRICGKKTLASAIDPLAEREKRYDALAEHYRRNLKLDAIYRRLDGQR